MIAELCGILAFAAPQRLGDRQTVPAFELEPGREWVYEGTIEQKWGGKQSGEGRHSFRLRYLPLEENEAGDRDVLLLRTVDPGRWRYGERERTTEKHEGAVLLALGPDLRWKSSSGAWYGFHPATPYLEFAPFLPTDAPRTPGETVEREEATWEPFSRDQVWKAASEESGVRVTCEPKRLPAPYRFLERETTLEAYRESYLLHPVSGVVREFELSWNARSEEEGGSRTEEVALCLRLIQTREMAPQELAARRSELGSVRWLREKIEAPGTDLDAAKKEVEALVGRLASSPVVPAASELEHVIAQVKGRQVHEAKEKEIRDRLLDKPAPDFAAEDLDGKEVRLSELRGKVVLLNFWASW